ncbi:RNA polymerase sigma factor [Rhodopirellula sallentina]|uniref:RNA polymerase sigma-H factor n=1 Tax=Rhodopirellula sallentina SM41 TaxID=1263870 RepID=M5U2Y2_9BACT|nr:sigma-70 family RNA polymerase sigma factor [Rhodopirellula sallentina]EMI55634.1 RNA polymerase sigma-H factor [Rhodopirellula sallentina SM41]
MSTLDSKETGESATRESLLRRAQADAHGSAWEELLQYYEPFVRRTLRAMGVEEGEADDVCQQVLAHLWGRLVDFQPDHERARFRTWLTRIIRNTAVSEYRKRMRRQRVSFAESSILESLAGDSSDIEQRIEDEWQRYLVDLAMERIDEIFSGNAVEVFLRSVEGESAADIGQSLGIHVDSVYVLKNRVRRRLVHEIKVIREMLEFPS